MANKNKINDSNENQLSSLTGSSRASKKKRKKDDIAVHAEIDQVMENESLINTPNNSSSKDQPSAEQQVPQKQSTSSSRLSKKETKNSKDSSFVFKSSKSEMKRTSSKSKSKPKIVITDAATSNDQYDSDVFIESNKNSSTAKQPGGSLLGYNPLSNIFGDKSKSKSKSRNSSYGSSSPLSDGKQLFGLPMLCCVYFASIYSLLAYGATSLLSIYEIMMSNSASLIPLYILLVGYLLITLMSFLLIVAILRDLLNMILFWIISISVFLLPEIALNIVLAENEFKWFSTASGTYTLIALVVRIFIDLPCIIIILFYHIQRSKRNNYIKKILKPLKKNIANGEVLKRYQDLNVERRDNVDGSNNYGIASMTTLIKDFGNAYTPNVTTILNEKTMRSDQVVPKPTNDQPLKRAPQEHELSSEMLKDMMTTNKSDKSFANASGGETLMQKFIDDFEPSISMKQERAQKLSKKNHLFYKLNSMSIDRDDSNRNYLITIPLKPIENAGRIDGVNKKQPDHVATSKMRSMYSAHLIDQLDARETPDRCLDQTPRYTVDRAYGNHLGKSFESVLNADNSVHMSRVPQDVDIFSGRSDSLNQPQMTPAYYATGARNYNDMQRRQSLLRSNSYDSNISNINRLSYVSPVVGHYYNGAIHVPSEYMNQNMNHASNTSIKNPMFMNRNSNVYTSLQKGTPLYNHFHVIQRQHQAPNENIDQMSNRFRTLDTNYQMYLPDPSSSYINQNFGDELLKDEDALYIDQQNESQFSKRSSNPALNASINTEKVVRSLDCNCVNIASCSGDDFLDEIIHAPDCILRKDSMKSISQSINHPSSNIIQRIHF